MWGRKFSHLWIIIFIWEIQLRITHEQISLPPIQHAQVEELLERAHHRMEEVYKEIDKNIYDKGTRQTPGTPAWYMAISHSIKPNVFNMTQTSMVIEEATRYMAEVYALSREQIAFALTEMDISYTTMGQTCPMTVDRPCEPKKYRAFTGYCNNVQNPRWGNANSKYSRLLMAAYEDGISLPRGGGILNKMSLPGPREVSLAVHSDQDRLHDYLDAMTVAWGQFIQHDLTHTPLVSGYNAAKLKCCGVNFNEFHPECFPIKLSEQEQRTTRRRRERCQEFVRSASALRIGCSLGPREQLNQATAFLDASHIYGNSRAESDRIRSFQRGELKMLGDAQNSIPGTAENCNGSDIHCFLTGDVRANENLGLSVLYTLWYREHNRIANQLETINQHWNDETLFQEARRIVIAEIQHITYNEFLPTVLSQNIIDKYNLKLEKTGYFNDYNINRNPGIINSVAHAAMWYIATLMPDVLVINRINDDRNKRNEEILKFSGTFFAPLNHEYETVLLALMESSTQKDDSIINEVMMNDMYKDNTYKGFGLDLAAQLIQRGRDHGLPSYTEFRKFCNLKPIHKFQDLIGITTPKIKSILENVYRNVSDIDLFTGALTEISMLGSVIGPTFSCLLGHQFQMIRISDRHWYENNIPPSSFKPKQLEEIRKITLSRLICDNSQLKTIQSTIFLKPDIYLNEKLACSSFPIMDLTQWKHDSSTTQIIMDTNLLKTIVAQAQNDIRKIFENENEKYSFQTPAVTAFKFNRPKREATIIANTSLLLQLASTRIVENYIQSFQDQETNKRVNSEEFKQLMSVLPEIDLTDVLHVPQSFQCDESELPCDHTTPFRSITGRCNNLQHPEFGKSMRSFNRLLTPAYDDGIGSPRQISKSGNPLPSARLISSHIHPDTSSPHRRYSLMLMQLAQIVDHDLTHTPVNVKHLGRGVLDCSPCSTTPSGCIPIPIPKGDSFYPSIDPNSKQPKCIPVTRSLPSRLTLGYREQMNQVTAYLDCSFVYGSDTCEMKQLRSFTTGKLNATKRSDDLKPLMPEIVTNPECRADSKVCFRAGDLRASEQPGLSSLHTIFLREHNRIAEELSRLNPHWTDEHLYQQTRRIIIAQQQHIVFSELLPRIFGWEHLEKYGLTLKPFGYSKRYDPECDVTLVNEFSAAAYRFGHSLLRPMFKRMNNKHVPLEPEIRLRDHFFNPALLYKENMIDELLMGLAGTPMETLDQFITREVSNHLFEDRQIKFSGMDLPAINIQRGRDHGIPGYNNYRQFCNLTRAHRFEDLQDLIPVTIVKELKKLYTDVDDIDLFPGGLVEVPLKGGIIGPTFACIIGQQFRKLRTCDRFWYEHDNPFTRFTPDQLTEIRKAILSRLICQNSDNIATIQRSLLDLPDPFLNPRVPCHTLKSLDLKYWKEQRRCFMKDTIIEIGSYEKVSPCVMCACSKEGIICESMRIDNCYTLAKIHSWDSILRDSVCKVQCAHAFSNLPILLNNTNIVG